MADGSRPGGGQGQGQGRGDRGSDLADGVDGGHLCTLGSDDADDVVVTVGGTDDDCRRPAGRTRQRLGPGLGILARRGLDRRPLAGGCLRAGPDDDDHLRRPGGCGVHGDEGRAGLVHRQHVHEDSGGVVIGGEGLGQCLPQDAVNVLGAGTAQMPLDLSGEVGAVVLPRHVHPGAGQAEPTGDGGACALELGGDGVGVLGLGVGQEHHGDTLGGQGSGQETAGGLSDVGVPLVDGRLSLLELGLGGVAVLTQGGDLVVERGS